MRNLSATGAIPSPIDADRDVSAYSTDFAKLGLPDHSPFDILSRMRAPIKATPPKPKTRRTQRERVIASLEDPKPNHFNVDIPTRAESDRTSAIAGRRLK